MLDRHYSDDGALKEVKLSFSVTFNIEYNVEKQYTINNQLTLHFPVHQVQMLCVCVSQLKATILAVKHHYCFISPYEQQVRAFADCCELQCYFLLLDFGSLEDTNADTITVQLCD